MDEIARYLSLRRTFNDTFRYLAMALFCLLLASCSHVRRDGPPHYYVDETKVPNAVPKPEPLAKYGNMKQYYVAGKRYKVMKTSKHYSAVGVASWYGTLFHDRKTSSGEPYDMLGMTAAHKSLPLPTYVRVTNLKNNREIIVKVNDRGPFKQNRIIDLSYVAAKKLGMLGKGTALVRVTAIDPYTYGRHPIYADANNERVQAVRTYVLTSILRNKMRAESLKSRLSTMLRTPVKVALVSSRRQIYQLQIGPFKDAMAANQTLKRLRTLGIQAKKVAQN